MEQKRLGTSLRAGLVARDLSENLGKLPPQAVDLEESILGALMIEREALHEVVDIISAEDFYLEQHKEIFTAVVDLYRNEKPVDMRTVVSQLRKNGRLEVVGGAYYIAELTSRVSSAANIEYHCRLLNEMSIKRQIIQIGSGSMHDAYEDTVDAFALLDDVQIKLDLVGGKYLKGNFQSAQELSKKTLDGILAMRNKKGLTGIPTGFEKLDRISGGWQNTDLIIIAARPGMGKTGLLLSAALNSSMNYEIPTAVFSLEMSAEQLMKRAYSSIAEVENVRIFKNYIHDGELMAIGDAAVKISKAPLYIDDTPAISIFEFKARARRLVREKGVKVIYVDYLQLMTGDKTTYNREQEISSVSRGLKKVAKELNVPIIALSQLSRGVESRGGDKRPMLQDLRESGAIEQDADIVMFLFRPEYYKITVDEDGRSTAGVMEVIIAKHRNGSLDSLPLKFIGKFTKVCDWDAPPQPAGLTPMSEITKRQNLDSGINDYRAPYKDDAPEPGPNDDMPF